MIVPSLLRGGLGWGGLVVTPRACKEFNNNFNCAGFGNSCCGNLWLREKRSNFDSRMPMYNVLNCITKWVICRVTAWSGKTGLVKLNKEGTYTKFNTSSASGATLGFIIASF